MQPNQSRLAFIAGIGLLAAFAGIQWFWALTLVLPAGVADTLAQIVVGDATAIRKAPGQWLARQGLMLVLAAGGMALLGAAALSPWPRAGIRLLRTGGKQLWTRIVWAVLLAYLATHLLSLAGFATPLPRAFDRGGSLGTLVRNLAFVPPLAGLYCCARLLFGGRKRSIDRWVGYIAAVTAAFEFAWSILGYAGLGRFMGPFAGLGGGRIISFGHLVSVVISLAMSWATIRAGLALARGHWRPAPVQGRASIACVLLGGLAANKVVSSLPVMASYASYLPVPHTLIYAGLLAALAGCALVGLAPCLQPGLRLSTDAMHTEPHVPSPVGARFRAFFGPPFWADFGLAFVAVCILLVISYGLLSTIHVMVWAFIFPLILLGFLAGPVLVFVLGIVRGRPGIAAAPVAMLLAVLVFRGVHLTIAHLKAEAAVDEAAALNVYPFAEPTRKQGIVVIEYSNESRPEGDCSPICQRILVTSDYAVAVAEQPGNQWRVYQREHGPRCATPERIDSYLTLLGWGFADTCIGMTRRLADHTALVIQESDIKESPLNALRPNGLRGEAFAFIERVDGQDRLLGRIFSGSVKPPLMSDQKPVQTPNRMTDYEFYAAALKLPIAQQPPRSDRDMAAVVAALEPYLADESLTPQQQNKARDAFRWLAAAAQSEAAELPIRDAILRLWQSPDRRLAHLGLLALRDLKHREFAKPHIIALMQSPDPQLMKDAVWALTAFKGDLEFGKAPLAELLLDDRAAAYKGDFRSVIDLLKMFEGPFPEDLRQEAKQRLQAGANLKREDILVVLAILWRGDERTRQEAVETIFGLDGPRFAEAIIAINHKSEALAPGQPTNFWSEADLERIVARLPEVPDERLADYVRFIQFQRPFKPHYGTVKDHLDARADALARGTPDQQNIAKKIEKAARELYRR